MTPVNIFFQGLSEVDPIFIGRLVFEKGLSYFAYDSAYLQDSPRTLCPKQVVASFLWHTTLPISKLATLCGFQDTSYFHRTFKCSLDMTPHQFRKQSEIDVNPHESS